MGIAEFASLPKLRSRDTLQKDLVIGRLFTRPLPHQLL
jgi:hypothetical protein